MSHYMHHDILGASGGRSLDEYINDVSIYITNTHGQHLNKNSVSSYLNAYVSGDTEELKRFSSCINDFIPLVSDIKRARETIDTIMSR